MKIYLDLIFFLNFAFDFILLLSVSILLKRRVPLIRLIFGSFIGGISIFGLFISFNNFSLFMFKIFISILMVLFTYTFKNFKFFFINLTYLYINSIILGGFLYMLNIHFAYKNNGLVFFHNNISINFIVLIILSPIIIYIYTNRVLKLKNHYSNYYKINIYFKEGVVTELCGFLDTGNNLFDPYCNRPIILIDINKISFDYKRFPIIMVPFYSVNHQGLLKCIKPLKIEIIGKGFKKNVLVGLSEEKINIDGVDCIMHSKLLEG